MFDNLKTLQYPYDGGVDLAALVLANLPIRLNIDRTFIIEKKYVGDGETAENLAWRLWKRADYHWVLLYINAIRDPYTEWPMRNELIHSYANTKYGFETMNVVHHFIVLNTGEWVEADLQPPYPANLTPITYLEHERNLNNARREIVAITPKYINNFVDAYNELIAGK